MNIHVLDSARYGAVFWITRIFTYCVHSHSARVKVHCVWSLPCKNDLDIFLQVDVTGFLNNETYREGIHTSDDLATPQNCSVRLIELKILHASMQFHIQSAITSVWKVQFQQFKHFSMAYNELVHMEHFTQKKFSAQK